ncbi:DNA (cytosine-5-)-methyltransferase [Vogesella fluminis]|uniref:Cytosine-specific methyltransferase n=1 Tax=Vogesella fluminis TaxID=1069161 RepID=A0ABQ3HC12_9NEIS|nr:DNA (cytosine-5-)-methyltransferase [Vogesella fluminis]GHD77584.1 cytosine-specific methyltransferase [Vogesella fluminis]
MNTRQELVHQYLDEALKYYSKAELANRLGSDQGTIRRWAARETEPKPYVVDSLKQLLLPFGPQEKRETEFRFIDLFAGIGGIRKAFERVGGECVFTSEWDTYAQKTYAANFRHDSHALNGDITQVNAFDIPDHDVLLAGFPCQPFSIAGVSKKNALGRAHGFEDETQGTLFFDVARILQVKRPRAFLLENVKNLMSHDKGRTFDVIRRTLSEELGYHIHCKIIDAQHFVPQHRERIVIVGFREPTDFNWDLLALPPKGNTTIKDILHKTDGTEPWNEHDGNKYFDHETGQVNPKYTLTPKLWQYLQNYAVKHREKGNGFGFGLVGPNSIARTLSARYYKDGSEVLVDQGVGKNPRRLTPRECARLMGLDDSFVIPVSDTRAYKQFGNSVVMPVFHAVAEIMKPRIVAEQFEPVIKDMWESNGSGVDLLESPSPYQTHRKESVS